MINFGCMLPRRHISKQQRNNCNLQFQPFDIPYFLLLSSQFFNADFYVLKAFFYAIVSMPTALKMY